MADTGFVKAKRDEKKTRRYLCRVGQHECYRNDLVVQYAPGVGVCRRCVGRFTQRHPGDSIDLASYWTRSWPQEQVCDVGQRRTWARP